MSNQPEHDREQAKITDTEEMSVLLGVKLGFIIGIGLYDGPVTKKMIAEHVERMIEDNGVEEFIDSINIVELTLDDGTQLVEGVDDA